MTYEIVQKLAKTFLSFAEDLNEEVSAYLDGSCMTHHIEAYDLVKSLEREFVKAYDEYYGESHEACLDYELAYSVL